MSTTISISPTMTDQVTSDRAPIEPFSGVVVSDTSVDQTETLTVTESTTADGVLSDPNAATDGSVLHNGVWTVTGSAAKVTADLDALAFTPILGQVPYGQSVTTGFTIAISDTAGQTASDPNTSVIAVPSLPATVLYNFNLAAGFGFGELTQDAAGDVFVTATYGGEGYTGPGTGDGSIFEFANTGTGLATTPTPLTTFLGSDGANPAGTLLFDASGDLFGLTEGGGADGQGTLFELANTNEGYASTPTVLVNFTGTDGGDPGFLFGNLITDAAGDLFGVTYAGGPGFTGGISGDGTVFELVKTGSTYEATPTILAAFDGTDGQSLESGLVADAQGDLFGTALYGGANNLGDVYEIVKTSAGYATTPQIVLSFDGTDGAGPQAGLYIDANGDLFGTTVGGGTDWLAGQGGNGVVFEIKNTASGYSDTPTVVSFDGITQGENPDGPLLVDAAGDLFGVTYSDEVGVGGPGTVFEIKNTATGLAATPTTLLTLGGSLGIDPSGTLLADANGDLIGTTIEGGANGDGALFEVANTGFFVSRISISGTEANQPASDQAPIDPFASVTIKDPNPNQTETVAVTPSTTTHGTLIDPNAATDGATIDQGVWTMTGSPAAVTAALQALEFQPTKSGSFGQTLTTGFSIAVADTEGQTALDTTTSVVTTAMAPSSDMATFTGGSIGRPLNLIADANGDLFGVQTGGLTGSNSDGGVFEIKNTATGYSAPFLLAGFSGLNGIGPDTPLIIDANGDLFGTAQEGGVFGDLPGGLGGGITSGDGVVFEIKNTSTGYDSTPIALVSFDVTDGRDLQEAPLIMDADGDLLGVAFAGGPTNQGDIFEIANTPTGYASTPTVLSPFSPTDAGAPIGGLITDAGGDLFGVTEGGGTYGDGTVYELKKTGASYATTPTILLNIGSAPELRAGPDLLIDANGDLFGAMIDGGADNDGTVWELLNTSTGYASTPITLATFDRTDGAGPTDLMFDAKGDILGTTSAGGAFSSTIDAPFGGGTVFEIANNNGTYASTPTVLVSFSTAEGYAPGQSLLLTATGTILGTVGLGGPDDAGAVFGITETGATVAPPAITGTAADQSVSDLATINPFASVAVSDQNPDQNETVTVTPSAPAYGSLVDPNAAADGSTDDNGVWSVTGSPLGVTQDLQGLVFHPAQLQASLGQSVTTGFTIAVTDTLGQSASDSTTSVVAAASVPSDVLYSFNEANALGWGQLSQDAAGDVFVDATYGGQGYSGPTTGYGSILEFTWTGTGYAATPTLLTEFQGTNGEHPSGTLLVDAAGNLFGATTDGGTDGNGVLFELPKIGADYASTPTVLLNFNGTDGQYPVGSLIEDANGDLFGVTYTGGPGYDGSPFSGQGTVFELVKNGASYATTPKTLATFSGPGALNPESGLVADAKGDLFGTTLDGGANGSGEVYEIVNTSTGYDSTPQVLFSFDGTDGALPQSTLYIDANGDLFGTTSNGELTDPGFPGTAFEIANTPTGYSSTPTIIYFNEATGSGPAGGVIADAAGDLFGVTDPDGIDAGAGPGSVYEIQNTATGLADMPVSLLAMGGNVGSDPIGTLIDDPDGDLVGVATSGGANGDGTLFELPAAFVEAPSSPNGLLHLTPQQGQTVSLDALTLNPAVTTNGVLPEVTLDGPGTATVNGIVSINTLEVVSGDLSVMGGSLLTDPITVDASGDITGFGTVTGAAINSGTITAVGGLLDVTGGITGAGTLAIENEATLELGSAAGAQQIVQFDTSADTGSAVLLLDDPVDFSPTIGAAVAGDSIAVNLSDAVLNGASLDPSGEVLTLTGSLVGGAIGTIGTVVFAQPLTRSDYSVANNEVTLTETPGEVPCFLSGTHIATEHGEMPVERLAVGDNVRTLSGVLRPITWIGVGKALVTRGRRSAATPVIVQKGAIADNVPHRDLHVTKGHSLFVDGVLIPVEFLVNHRSIRWDDRAQEVSIFHIELDAHGVLLANGAPAESYRDDGNRWLFRNANTGWDLPPKPPCAPVLTGGAAVDAVWRRLLERAGPRNRVPCTDDPDLHLVVDGRRLDAAVRAGGALVFKLAGGPDRLRIVPRAAVPQELGVARDSRCLGVALRSIVVRQGSRFRIMHAEDARLVDGYHNHEQAIDMRWTDGDAAVPDGLLADFTGPIELVLNVVATAQYPDDGDVRRVA